MHAYTAAAGPIKEVISHLRKSFPATFDASALKKLGLAPKNESYTLNVLRFLGIIDESGARVEAAHKIFSLHDDSQFQKAFSQLVTKAYADLFELHSEAAWGLNDNELITFFRSSDQSSQIVGKRQARTFKALAEIAGRLPQTPSRVTPAKLRKEPKSGKDKGNGREGVGSGQKPKQRNGRRDFGLTVRIEVNLPSQGDQQTYDRIFQSIRKYLIDVE